MSSRQLCCVLGLVLAFTGPALADSPVTSTPFHEAYLDYAIVREARDLGIVTEDIAHYLAIEDNPLDVRAAAVNALGWSIDGKDNAQRFCRLRFPEADGIPDADELRGDQALVIGYLMLMDDYFHAQEALPWLEQAREELADSTTAGLVHALCQAQVGMDDTDRWATLWDIVAEVVDDTTLNGDIRVGALRIVTDYMVLYAEEEGQ